MLEMIRDYCTNIATLETLLYTSAEMEPRLDAADSPRAADEALTLVDARFKAIPSLKEVIVNLYDKPPSDYLRKKIQNRNRKTTPLAICLSGISLRDRKGSWKRRRKHLMLDIIDAISSCQPSIDLLPKYLGKANKIQQPHRPKSWDLSAATLLNPCLRRAYFDE